MAMGQYPDDWDQRRKRVYRRDNYRCQNCGRQGGRRGNAELHAHHRQPVSKGGSHRTQNLVTVCKNCHESIHGHRIPTGGSSGGRSRATGQRRTDEEETQYGSAEGFLSFCVWFGLMSVGRFFVPHIPTSIESVFGYGWFIGSVFLAYKFYKKIKRSERW